MSDGQLSHRQSSGGDDDNCKSPIAACQAQSTTGRQQLSTVALTLVVESARSSFCSFVRSHTRLRGNSLLELRAPKSLCSYRTINAAMTLAADERLATFASRNRAGRCFPLLFLLLLLLRRRRRRRQCLYDFSLAAKPEIELQLTLSAQGCCDGRAKREESEREKWPTKRCIITCQLYHHASAPPLPALLSLSLIKTLASRMSSVAAVS